MHTEIFPPETVLSYWAFFFLSSLSRTWRQRRGLHAASVCHMNPPLPSPTSQFSVKFSSCRYPFLCVCVLRLSEGIRTVETLKESWRHDQFQQARNKSAQRAPTNNARPIPVLLRPLNPSPITATAPALQPHQGPQRSCSPLSHQLPSTYLLQVLPRPANSRAKCFSGATGLNK